MPGPATRENGSRRATSAVQIYDRLRHQVVTGALRPLDCLSETELAASLGVSRTPIREALGKLEEEGLVEIRPRFGTFVAAIHPGAVQSSQFVREALECAAVQEAARRCTAADKRELLDSVAQQKRAINEEEFVFADDAMHRLLMTMAGHEATWRVVQAAKAVIDRVRYLSVQRSTKRKAILSEHRQIIRCVVAGDAVGAALAMQAHLRGVFASIEHSIRAYPEFFIGYEAEPRPNRHRPREHASVRSRAATIGRA